MDAQHFRHKAARAREMAQSGDDIRLSRMLLEVAIDLDAEAEAIEAQSSYNCNISSENPTPATSGALLHSARLDPDATPMDATPIEIVNLSVGGVKFRIPRTLILGSHMILELSQPAIRLNGTIVSVCGSETIMIFDPEARAHPGLFRLLQPQHVFA